MTESNSDARNIAFEMLELPYGQMIRLATVLCDIINNTEWSEDHLTPKDMAQFLHDWAAAENESHQAND